MSRQIPLLLCLGIILAAPAFAATPKKDSAPKEPASKETGLIVREQGLRIVKPVPGNEDHKNDLLRPFNAFTGTSVSLLVQSPKGGIISIAQDRCEVASMADDKGTDLSKPAERGGFQESAKIWPFAAISPDGKLCQVEVQAPGVPASGATKVLVKGKIAVTTASVKKDFAAEGVALKPGTAVKAGAVAFTVKGAGKPQWGDMPLQVSLEANQELTDIADIQFFNAAGKKIESHASGDMSMRGPLGVTITRDILLKEKVDSVKIVVTYWMDAKTEVLPLDLKAGVGF